MSSKNNAFISDITWPSPVGMQQGGCSSVTEFEFLCQSSLDHPGFPFLTIALSAFRMLGWAM